MTGTKDLFSAQADDYARYRPDYPSEFINHIVALCARRDTAWDAATGNGQTALALAPFFRQIYATDISRTQLANARAANNIAYAVAPAEKSGLADGCADLITVSQAIHWFDLPAFAAEARRVAAPDALLAVWGYGRCRITPEIDRLYKYFYRDKAGPWWPPERTRVESGYADLALPFPALPFPNFAIERDWYGTDMLGYLSSWSAVQRCREATGRDLVIEESATWLAAWGPGLRRVTWPLFGRFWRL